MKKYLALIAILGLAATSPATAEDMPKQGMPMPGSGSQGSPSGMMGGSMGNMSPGQDAMIHQGHGTIKSLDLDEGRVVLNHQPIQSLHWPAMTMSFSVKDKAQLRTLKPGMAVDFDLEKSGSAYQVTRIAPAKR